jgi:hypothetical protein
MFIKFGTHTFNSAHIVRIWPTTEKVQIETINSGQPQGIKPEGEQTTDELCALIERMLGAQSPAEWEQGTRETGQGQMALLEAKPLIDEDKLIGEFKGAMANLCETIKSLGKAVDGETAGEISNPRIQPPKKSQTKS